MGEQHLFQEEIYRLNREIKRFLNLQGNALPVILSAVNSLDRTINYFPVREDACDRWSLEKEKKKVESFLRRNEEGFTNFLLHFEKGVRERADDLHSFLIHLYNHFPVDPTLFLDGITRRFLSEFIENGKLIRYAFVNLLDKKNAMLDYNYFPWVDIRFFHTYPPDQNPTMGAVADQESTRVEKYGKWFDIDHGPLENAILGGARPRAEGFQLEPFFFEYLQPFFMGYEKGGEVFSGKDFFYLKDQDLARLQHLVIIPFYDAWIDGNPCGSLKGNLLIPFEEDSDYEKRTEFIEKHFRRFSDWSRTLNQLLYESRSHHLLRLPIQYESDPLKEFLGKIALVQNWEKARIFRKSYSGHELEGCFKRQSGGESGYQKLWVRCETGKDCLECLPEGLRSMLAASMKNKRAGDHDQYAGVKIDFRDLLDPRILPSIEPNDLTLIGEQVICLEWPETTYLPNGVKNRDSIQKLRNYYTEQMIPVLDRVIQKNKVLRHSIKTAVSAIISRNHSHHIGSHVTPRVGIKRIEARLKELHCHARGVNARLPVINLLRGRLDEYIQKKADFMAEISTEPLTTTKTASLFSEVLLPFIGNTLLMDNIGANEGVNYRRTTGENRLKIHVHHEGKELIAEFGGGSACGCKAFNPICYPYSASCSCKNPKPLHVVSPAFHDVSVALPGPLGEFALYCFLENFIRNSIKHNFRMFRANLALDLNVNINISNQGNPEFYKVEVWDDVTPLTMDLKETLNRFIEEPIIDRHGQLKRGGWGIAEMKIMACLLQGRGDLAPMNTSLKVCGDELLVYEFLMMKPKEVAVISRNRPEGWNQGAKGVWWFSSPQEFADQQARGASPASFHLAVIEESDRKELTPNWSLLPYRILLQGKKIHGTVEVDDVFMETLQNAQPETIVSSCWRRWIEGLNSSDRSNSEKRLVLFFGQDKETVPTSDWLDPEELCKRQDFPVKLSVIHQGKRGNEVRPVLSRREQLFVFDRHFDGYPCLEADERITFHEMIDKNSWDYTSIFCSKPSDTLFYGLSEGALLNILVLDERVAQVAHEEIMEDKSLDLYKSKKRIEAAKWANIFIATHVRINDGKPQAIHPDVNRKAPWIMFEIRTGAQGRSFFEEINLTWHSGHEENAILYPDAVIIHQGLLDGFFKSLLFRVGDRQQPNGVEAFLTDLREHIPYVAVDSGRGIPASLPPYTKFIPFSLIEQSIMKDRISKYVLTRMLMSLTRRGNR